MQRAVVWTLAGLGTAMAVGFGGVFATAAFTGGKVLQRLDAQTDELARAFPVLKVVDKSVQRGPFSTTRDVTLQLGCLPPAAQQAIGAAPGKPEPMQVHWRDVVHHGPFPGGSSLGFASIDSELVSPPAYKARIDRVTGNKPLLSVHSTVSFSGALESDVVVPALHYADAQTGGIDTKPLRAHVTSSASTDSNAGGTYHTEVPGFELVTRANDGTSLTVTMGKLTGKTEVAPHSGPALWLSAGKSTASTSSLELRGTAASALPIKPVQMVFQNLIFSVDSKLDQGLFSSSSRVTGKGRINQVTIDKLELAGSVKRLHAATYQKLMGTLFSTVLSCDPAAQQNALENALPAMQEDLLALLVHNPAYALDTLAVEVFGKRAELSYSVGTEGVTAADAQLPLPALLLTKGVLRAGAKVHTGLIAHAVAQLGAFDPGMAAAAGLPASAPGASPADATLTFVNGMVDQFVQLGYLSREGELVKAAASYEAGQVLVNGKPMALPDLGALGK